jgi:hypothetical protein
MTSIATQADTAPALSQQDAFVTMLERVIRDDSVDLSRVQALLDVQERVRKEKAATAYAEALAEMQPQLPRVIRSRENSHTKAKYAPLEDINQAITPALQKYGFSVFFTVDQGEKTVSVTAALRHSQGHTEKATITLPIDTQGAKSPAQQIGSTVTYGKRYALCAILNISTGDTDGNPPEPLEPEITTEQRNELKRLVDNANPNAQEWFEKTYRNNVYAVPSKHFENVMAAMRRAQVQS